MMRGIGGLSLVLALAVAPSVRAAGTWTLQRGEAEGVTTAIGAIDELRAVAFGMQKQPGSDDQTPVMLTTKDGGAQWTVAPAAGHAAGAMVMVMDMVCPKPTKCLALATSIDMGGASSTMIANRVITSSDGGGKWFWPPAQWTGDWSFNRMDLVTEQDIWLSGGPNVIVHSTDGGKSFKSWKRPEVGGVKFDDIQDLAFVSTMVGYAVNSKIEKDDKGNLTSATQGALLKTTDGGATWTALFTDKAEAYDRLEMATEQAGWLVGQTTAGPFLRRTSDGGQTWDDVAIPQPAFTVPQGSTPAVKWIDNLRLFDADNGILLTSAPFGQDQAVHAIFEIRGGSLVEVAPDPLNNVGSLLGLSCVDASTCWAGGSGLSLLKYEDKTVVPPSDSTPGGDLAAGDNGGTPGDIAGQPDVVDGDAYVPRDLAGYWDTTGGGGSSGCSAQAVPGAASVVPALLGFLALVSARVRRRR